ncbi:hypothetical protein JOF48_003032 [Arthrobacter stackebrandtii]|uniref:Oxidoreductase n=1 Tax=Arthrobacter stackebrandtii TaxID=272161 RepID=A0ABS4YZK5_9MICC|nr:hypothetical protein [Arthrobacter stackebrandtii]
MKSRSKKPVKARRRDGSRQLVMSAVAGVIAAGALFAVAQLLSSLFGAASSPLTSVGSTFIDFTPAWMKNFAIATFGTNDKTVLLLSTAAAAIILSALAGVVARKRFAAGAGMVGAFAIVMAACVITRAGATGADLLPLLAGTAAGLAALRFLTGAATARRAAPTPDGSAESVAAQPSRRAFLVRSAVLAGAAVVVGVGGTLLSTARNTARQVRDMLTLPAPRVPAPALPAGAQSPIAGWDHSSPPTRISTGSTRPWSSPSWIRAPGACACTGWWRTNSP